MGKIAGDEPYESALTDIGKPFELVMPTSFNIQIEREKCHFSHYDPRGCKECIKICPAVVFGAMLNERRVIGRQPQHYNLVVVWPEMCNGCGACMRACPHQAISIKKADQKS